MTLSNARVLKGDPQGMTNLRNIAFAAMAALLPLISTPARADADPAACRTAIRAAEARYDLPRDLLLAMGIVESRLYPWALNLAGDSRMPGNIAEAELLLVNAGGEPRTDIMVGCMQIHTGWHLAAFDNQPQRLLDPATNADYAGHLLRTLYDDEQSWTRAVGRYNAGSAGGAAYHRYICLVEARLREIGSDVTLACNQS